MKTFKIYLVICAFRAFGSSGEASFDGVTFNMEPYGQIYLITNNVNGKIYIGQTINTLKKRMQSHFSQSRYKKKYNTPFLQALNKHGEISFSIECICVSLDKEALNEAEISLIKQYDSRNKSIGYNLSEGGSASRKGAPMSDETKLKLSKVHKGRKQSPESIAKRALAMTGRIFSQETRNKIADRLKGNKNGLGQTHPYKGKKRPKTEAVLGRLKYGIENPTSKAVVQLDDNKIIIKEFVSLREAKQKTGINNISRSILKKTKSGGFYWEHSKKQ